MNRTKLLWFAMGAGVAGCLSIAAAWFFEPVVLNDKAIAYLILFEPTVDAPKTSQRRKDGQIHIADRTGELVRGCGAVHFEMTSNGPSRTPTTELPIVNENAFSLNCIFEQARKQSVTTKIEHRWATSAYN